MKINFLGLPDHPQAKVALVPIPFEYTTTWLKGTKFAPLEILKVSSNLEFFDEETALSPYETLGFYTYPLEEYPLEYEKALQKIEEIATEVLRKNFFPIFIGGEHTITYKLIKILKEKYSKLKLLHLDAHLDFRETYLESRINHATFLRYVNKEGISSLSLGIRALSQEEYIAMKEKNLQVIFAHELKTSYEENLRKIENFLRDGHVYLTIDMDVLDPSLAPGVGTPEPGGLLWYELMPILKKVAESNVVGMDLVETRPISHNPITEFIAAKIILKFSAYLAKAKDVTAP